MRIGNFKVILNLFIFYSSDFLFLICLIHTESGFSLYQEFCISVNLNNNDNATTQQGKVGS